MLPDLSLTALVREAAEPAPAPVAQDGEPGGESPRKRAPRAPRTKPAPVDRSSSVARTVWLSPDTWNRVRLAAARKGANMSELVEEILRRELPDLVLSERSAAA